ncbi:MDR family NADPH-dependent oxidoreductase [Cerasicoccus arenae]|uniref:enoyl-[acyl-carrier-protein] reductase n=1 Tax=Cerasicoccus arenae TaxID=424488 RepID=A0A8J3D9I3_9BACT|nr:2-enoyl thioester reductase domain-containing protein [Cerasicoccus arenae]MBK1859749.1 2-enoyl thioester reductase domain-containing protein [Cerasicoccus arenae]GHB93591.1 trans-2-enoyl-CoA reductase [Cerasicoccus arenae]
MKISALRYHEHGNPSDVLRLDNLELANPGPGEALVALRAAVLHPSDLGLVGGTYGNLRTLPAVAGREGVGEVLAVGPGVKRLALGDRVRLPEEIVLADACLADADSLEKAPADLPLDQAAMAFLNPPTAYRLLQDFGELQPGDWIIQNAANSAVGQCVIGLAKHRGLHTINLARDVAKWTDPLKAMGADAVLADGDDFFKVVDEITGGQKASLGLNSVGGDSVIKMIRSMAESGVVVTFGGMVGDKVRFPTRNLIFDDIVLRGFWMDRWSRQADASARGFMQHAVNDLIRQGVFNMSVSEHFALKDGIAAFEAAQSGGRDGKVIVTGDFSL